MKKLLMLAVLFTMGFTSLAVADNEGVMLGKAWHAYNKAAALIAVKDDNGDWKYDQAMIDSNADDALDLLKQASTDAEAAKSDAKGSVKTGKNSIKSLEYLIARAKQAIVEGADSFDKKAAAEKKHAPTEKEAAE